MTGTTPEEVTTCPVCREPSAAGLCDACLAGATPSPCLTDCVLDPSLRACSGCLRTLAEIERWPRLDALGRRLLYLRLAERHARHGRKERR